MEIAGRITNTVVNELKDGRKVVNFSIVVNDRFKRKDDEQFTEVATFFNCSYWRNPAIAQYLTKGNLVQVYGRVSVSAYNNAAGEAKGSLQFHVNEIKFLGGTAKQEQSQHQTQSTPQITAEEKEDLPF
mgnify:CR=1 FL=1